MTCRDCIYHKTCCYVNRFRKDSDGEKRIIAETNNVEDTCEDFSDRYAWVKLPCRVGTTVYTISCRVSGEGIISVGKVERFSIVGDRYLHAYVYYGDGLSYWHTSEEFGKIVFFTYEKAERALKDRSGE